ncbi:MAG: DUF4337 domain-containing protein [Magnetococcales bacterium]|nr:DUF4337 domain-containing protein [Magnetococcales bacterium]
MEILETHEQIHEAGHAGHEGHAGGGKKYVAIMISILACLLALIETGVNGSQSAYVSYNIEASDDWAFYQAKSIRMTTMTTAADMMEAMKPAGQSAEQAAAWQKRIADWRATAQRYDSDPEKGEGRKELSAKAKAAEAHRDHVFAAYHLFEYGAAALQIAIVMASASVVTGMMVLVYGAAGLGVAGVAFGLLGWLAPTLIHL